VILREEVTEKRVLRIKFGLKRDQTILGWRILYNEGLHD
jgi:hypothetical protein